MTWKHWTLMIAMLCSYANAAQPVSTSHSRATEKTSIALLQEVQNYLNGITTFRSKMVQYNSHGAILSGHLTYQRFKNQYGRMCITYDNSMDRIVSDGTRLYVQTEDNEEIGEYDIDVTPAALLLKPRINLTHDLGTPDVQRHGDRLFIRLTLSHIQSEIVLAFQYQPYLKLIGWQITDAQSNTTEVNLTHVQIGIPIKPEVFAPPIAHVRKP